MGSTRYKCSALQTADKLSNATGILSNSSSIPARASWTVTSTIYMTIGNVSHESSFTTSTRSKLAANSASTIDDE